MKLNHLDLHVDDVRALVTFLVTHFDLELRTNPASPAIAVLGDREGFTLVIQRAKGEAKYPEGFHIGFIVDDVSMVHARHARMLEAGVARITPVETNGRGTMFYCRGPGNLVIEVSCPGR